MGKFIIEKKVWDVIPNLAVGVLVLKNVQEDKKLSEDEAQEVKALLDSANANAKKYVPNETISENDVVKVWRQTYQAFPTKKGARCSVENLLKRVLHDNPVGSILPSVDITNAISLEYALPIGAEDRDKFEGDLRLAIMNGDEHFLPIGAESEEPPLKNEIAYRDDYGVVCRCLNWRDGQRTQINDNTKREFIAMECVEPERLNELQDALDKLSTLMSKYLGAEIVSKDILTKDNNEITLD